MSVMATSSVEAMIESGSSPKSGLGLTLLPLQMKFQDIAILWARIMFNLLNRPYFSSYRMLFYNSRVTAL